MPPPGKAATATTLRSIFPAAGSNFVDHAGPLTQMVLLGNFAVRAGKPIDVDPATGNLKTTGIPEHFWKPEYRKGWAL